MKSIPSSVSEVVRKIISSKPMLAHYVCMDVVNHSALARKLRDEVSKYLGKDVKVDTVKIAIIRFREKECARFKDLADEVRALLSQSSIKLEHNAALAIVRKEALLLNLENLGKVIQMLRFFNMLQGPRDSVVIVPMEGLTTLMSIVGQEYVETVYANQAVVIVSMPKLPIEVPHALTFLIGLLTLNGVRVTHIASCNRDIVIVVPEDDASTAYELITDVAQRMDASRRS